MSITRRSVLAGLAAGPGLLAHDLAAQELATLDPSLYIPKAHLVEDRQFLHDFMDHYAFVDLVTPAPTLRITHIPVVLDRAVGRYGTIFGHVSAQNPQNRTFDGSQQAVIVFRGPHGYISPTWYAKTDVVPTWNFAVVHASGRPKAITDPADARALLGRLIKKFEGAVGSGYDFSKLPDAYVAGMIKGIAPFSMEVEALEGKFKLGQERSDGDKQGVLAHLRENPYRERSLSELTETFYKRASDR